MKNGGTLQQLGMTNAQLAKTDKEFLAACEKTGVYPCRKTYRQWKYGRGRIHQLLNSIDSNEKKNIQAKLTA